MALLKDLVEELPLVYRMRYDFADFWIPKTNEVIKLIAQIAPLAKNVREVGVVVQNERWIDIPTDCREDLDVYSPDNEDSKWPYEVNNGKIKLKDAFSEEEVSQTGDLSSVDPKTVALPIAIPTWTSFKNALLVCVDEDGKTIGTSTVWGVVETAEGIKISLIHEFDTSIDIVSQSVPAYLVKPGGYLILRGKFDYKKITTENDEVPLSDCYEKAIITGLRMKIAEELEDMNLVRNWFQLMQWELGLLKLDQGKLLKLKQQVLPGAEGNNGTSS